MSNIINNYSSTIVTMYQTVINTYESNVKLIKQTEQELNDINHEAELANDKDMYHGYLIYKNIREIRRRRRQAKNENEMLKELYEYFKSQQGQSFKSQIQRIQSCSSKIEAIQEHRTYSPRQRDDLTIKNKTCETKEPFEKMLSDFKKTKVSMHSGKLRK